jgi:hypothetical protein
MLPGFQTALTTTTTLHDLLIRGHIDRGGSIGTLKSYDVGFTLGKHVVLRHKSVRSPEDLRIVSSSYGDIARPWTAP